VVVLVLAMRLVAEMLMVPSQHQGIDSLLRDERKKCSMHGCNLLQRDQDIVKMGPDGLKKFRQPLIINFLDEV
jgi:hypothetical protein